MLMLLEIYTPVMIWWQASEINPIVQMCQLQLYSQLRDNGKMKYRFKLHFSEQNRKHQHYFPV